MKCHVDLFEKQNLVKKQYSIPINIKFEFNTM